MGQYQTVWGDTNTYFCQGVCGLENAGRSQDAKRQRDSPSAVTNELLNYIPLQDLASFQRAWERTLTRHRSVWVYTLITKVFGGMGSERYGCQSDLNMPQT